MSSLKFLNSEQALADLASFRYFIYEYLNLTNINKLVTFGSSYSGSLSAWFRLKYPHLAHAAVSSSAPLLASVDFSDYLLDVKQSIFDYSNECAENFEKSIEEIENLSKTSNGLEKIMKIFKYYYSIILFQNK